MPPLYGLILSGGKSTRMGTDKGLLNYHGIPQRDFLYGLSGSLCDQVFLSIRPDQQLQIAADKNTIVDDNRFRGPFNGILSAHKQHPNVAWLVLACDLPLLKKETVQYLIANRNPSKAATAYATKRSQLPEPLIAIWETSGLQRATEHMQSAESSCPRKFLLRSDVQLVFPERDEVLYNANSLQEYEFAKAKLN